MSPFRAAESPWVPGDPLELPFSLTPKTAVEKPENSEGNAREAELGCS